MKPLYPLFQKGLTKYDIIGFDIETTHRKVEFNKKSKSKTVTGESNDFYLGGLYSNEDGFNYFFHKETMIKELLSKKYNGKIIVATNLGFDFNALFFGTKYWSRFHIILRGGQLLSATYTIDEKHSVVFMDTGNFIPFSVSQMGKILKIPKLETPACLGRFPKSKKEQDELLFYNKRDCEISKSFLELLQTTFNNLGGQLKMTIASSSMDLYRRKYHRFIMKHETEILKDDTYYDFLFSGYYGGRTEAFSRGKVTKAKVYDINSLYPSVMLKDFPHPLSVRKMIKPTISMLDYYLKFKGIMKVKITSPKYMKYPYLPHKYKVKDGTKLVFPLGSWTGTYTNFELKRAIELGYKINRIDKAYIYRNSYFPFRDFVTDLYALRLQFKKDNSPMELGVKLLLNSQYGKWASHYVSEVSFIDTKEMNNEDYDKFIFESGRNIEMRNDNLGIETEVKTCDSSFVFPILPLYVTAYARDVLYSFIVKHNALYCDTDSILTYDTLEETSELGGMKVEYDVLNGIVIKPKMYMYDTPDRTVTRMKGVSRVNKEKFLAVVRGETISYQKFTKTKESIRRGLDPNTIIQMIKKVNLEDTKRIWAKKFDPLFMEESKPLIIDD